MQKNKKAENKASLRKTFAIVLLRVAPFAIGTARDGTAYGLLRKNYQPSPAGVSAFDYVELKSFFVRQNQML
ncbi:MAG: hypothetical protein HRT35_11240 [Algicola sp.]|nr:hypothetical protein [Algicola sp.]